MFMQSKIYAYDDINFLHRQLNMLIVDENFISTNFKLFS